MIYVSKPVEIEAIQFTGNVDELVKFVQSEKSMKNSVDATYSNGKWSCIINSPFYSLVVLENDYVIRVNPNELSVMKPDTFERLYELKK